MNRPSDDVRFIIDAARAGERRALNHARSWVPREYGGGRIILVDDAGTLTDPTIVGAQRRREVFEPFIRFGGDGTPPEGFAAQHACARVRACPLLARVFQTKALAHLGALERQLHLDETLDARGRGLIYAQLRVLAAAGRTVWEQWVHATPRSRRDQFDAIVKAWLDAPVDLSEQQFFVADWRSRDYAAAAAGAFFISTFCDRLYWFLGVGVQRINPAGVPYWSATLDEDPQQANGWASSIGLDLRFEEAEESQVSAPNPTKATTQRWRAA
jgi:hypothetical protein